jgi:hypothetical protein
MTNWDDKSIEKLVKLRSENKTWKELTKHFKGMSANALRKAFYRHTRDSKAAVPAKVLVLDIETSPIVAYVWGLFKQNISLNQIVDDWSILSFSAKWVGSDTVIYMDTRKERNVRNDKKVVMALWKLLNEADVVLSQNGIRFDVPKINSRFLHYNLPPTTSFQHIDTYRINKRNFGHTSNKLEYLTKKFCKKYKKSGHKKFPGMELWNGCLAGNKEAWVEMEDYNKIDVLALEELYLEHLRVWDKTVNFNVYRDEEEEYHCSCGSTSFKRNGFVYTNTAKFQRWTCNVCGQHHQDKQNLLSKTKKGTLRK